MEPKEAIEEFYKLKHEYETAYYNQVLYPIISSKKSTKEKRRAYEKARKPKCINCQRPVGTLFTITYNNDLYEKYFKAKCGSNMDPCILDINIKKSIVENIEDIINNDNKDINKHKENIIKAKNNLLFGYIKKQESFETFEKITEELNEYVKFSILITNKYIERVENPDKEKDLIKKQTEINLYVKEFRDMCEEIKKNSNNSLIKTALDFYLNQMVPLINEITKLKYDIKFVEYDSDEDTYKLIEKKNKISKYEYIYGGDTSKVISFKMGMENPKTAKKPQTQNLKSTKKIEDATIILTPDEEEIEEVQLEEPQEESNVKTITESAENEEPPELEQIQEEETEEEMMPTSTEEIEPEEELNIENLAEAITSDNNEGEENEAVEIDEIEE